MCVWVLSSSRYNNYIISSHHTISNNYNKCIHRIHYILVMFALSLFLSFNMDYFIFEKKTKRKTTTIDVWSISKVNYRRRRHRIKRERIEKPTQYLTLTLSRTLTTPLLIIINWSHIYTYIDIWWIFERLTNKSSSSCVCI